MHGDLGGEPPAQGQAHRSQYLNAVTAEGWCTMPFGAERERGTTMVAPPRPSQRCHYLSKCCRIAGDVELVGAAHEFDLTPVAGGREQAPGPRVQHWIESNKHARLVRIGEYRRLVNERSQCVSNREVGRAGAHVIDAVLSRSATDLDHGDRRGISGHDEPVLAIHGPRPLAAKEYPRLRERRERCEKLHLMAAGLDSIEADLPITRRDGDADATWRGAGPVRVGNVRKHPSVRGEDLKHAWV